MDFKKWINNNFDNPDLIDSQHWDSSLSDSENKNIIIEKFMQLYKHKDKIIVQKAKGQVGRAEDEEEMKIIREEEELIRSWKDSKPEDLISNSKLSIVRDYLTAMLKNPEVNLSIIIGEGGIGKTYITLNTLKQEDASIQYVNTHITPLELYKMLYKYSNDYVIVLDDVNKLLNDEDSINILMAATWKAGNERIVTYNTSESKMDGVPRAFAMNSKIVVLANSVPDKEKITALKSRGFYYDLKLNYREKMGIIESISRSDIKGSSEVQREKAMSIMRKKTDYSTLEVNFRTFLKCLWLVQYDSEKAEELFSASLKTDDNVRVVKNLMEEGISTNEQVDRFRDLTGLGRTSYFQIKKQLKEEIL